MTDCAKKHMIYLTAWFLCMGFILLSNFSWIALGILVVLSVVSLYKNVFGVDGKIFQYTTLNIRYYILISVLFIECIYIIKNWNGFDSKYIGDNFFTLIEDAFSKITGYCKTHLSFVIPGSILSVFFVAIRGKLVKHPFIHTLFEYQFTILFYSLVWAALFDNADLNLAYIIFAVLFLMGDLVRKVYDEDKTLGNKAGKRCMGWFSFILMLAAIFNLQVAEQLEAFDFDMVTVLFSKWSTFLFLFIMSLAVLISVSLIEPYLRTGYAYEKSVLLTVTSIIPVIFVSTRICVGYRWALLICYFAYVLISVIKIGPRALDDKYTYTINDYLPVPILSISSIFLMLEAQYGRVLIAAIFLISTLILVLVYKSLNNIDDDGKLFTRCISSVIIWLYVNTLPRLWLFHHHYSAYIIISVITVAFWIVIHVLNYNPGIYEDNFNLTFGELALPVLYLVIALVIFAYGGSHIDVVVENEYIQIAIEADGEDNTIAEAKYCWIKDMTEFADDILNEKTTGYTSLTENQSIKAEDGLLKIIVEDQNGVKTIKKRWCSSNE